MEADKIDVESTNAAVVYSVTVLLEVGKRHLYKFIIGDNEWVLDGQAVVNGEKLLDVDASGNTNHVLDLTNDVPANISIAPSFIEADFTDSINAVETKPTSFKESDYVNIPTTCSSDDSKPLLSKGIENRSAIVVQSPHEVVLTDEVVTSNDTVVAANTLTEVVMARHSMDEASSYETAAMDAAWSQLSTTATTGAPDVTDASQDTMLTDTAFGQAIAKEVVYQEPESGVSMTNTVVVCGDTAAAAIENCAAPVTSATAEPISIPSPLPVEKQTSMQSDDLMLPMSLPAFLEYSQNSMATIDSVETKEGEPAVETVEVSSKSAKPSRFSRIKSFFKHDTAA